MTIQIEEGKFYKRADGSLHGPAERVPNSARYPWRLGTVNYTDQGWFYCDEPEHKMNLVAEAEPERTLADVIDEVETEAAEERQDPLLRAMIDDVIVALDYPDNNPKTAFGRAKPPLHAIPPSALLHLGLAMENGEVKYGLFNWREHQVSSSVYYDAGLRHFLSWWDGENLAADSAVHHLGHVMACCAILIDAIETGKINDDRGHAGAFSAVVERMREERSKSA